MLAAQVIQDMLDQLDRKELLVIVDQEALMVILDQ